MKNKIAAFLLPVILSLFLYACTEKKEENRQGWSISESILKEIKPPSFPEKTYNIKEFGAPDDSTKDSRQAIQKAIDICSVGGGGKVIIPPGTYYSAGPITLKENVNLHIAEGVVINFSTNPGDYLPLVFSRWEGVELYNYSALIYARDVKNIAITGKGILNGKASNDNWWTWKGREEYGWQEGMPSQADSAGRPRLLNMNNTDVPLGERKFGEGSYLRPNFVQFINCKNILIEGVTFTDSPMWFVHPVLCQYITVKGITVKGKGPNNDGLDPESCKNVLIEDCFFDTGDDCIAIKSGRNNDGRRIAVPSENIIVRNCKMNDGHGGIVIGSEISGGCKNVFAENCEMSSPNLDRALRVKTNHFRGGKVENIFMRNVTVGVVKEAVVKLNLRYDIKNESGTKFIPEISGIYVDNVTSEKSKYALYLDGLEESEIKNVIISDSRFNGVEDGNYIQNVTNLKTEEVYINGKLFKN